MKKHIKKLFINKKESLQGKTLLAAFWSFVGSGGQGMIRFISNLILTRLLVPEAFGLMATAMVVVRLVQTFTDTGVQTALIQNPMGNKSEYINTAFMITIIRNIFLFFVVTFSIKFVVGFYNEPKLFALLWIISFALLIEGFINPALPLVIKNLEINRQVFYAIGSQLAGFISTLILVLYYQDVKAVAVGYLLTSFFRVIASYIVIKYRPKFTWDSDAGKDLLHFGKFIMINTMITWAVFNLDRLIIGKTLSMEQLGYYNIALYIGLYVSDVLVKIFSQSFFPALSSISQDREKVLKIYKKTMDTVVSVVVPALMLIVLFSREIIEILYDPRYSMAGIILFWISFKSIIDVLQNIQSSTLLALGKPLYITISMTVGLIVLSVLLPRLSKSYGLMGSGMAVMVVSVIFTSIQSVLLIVKMKFPIWLVLRPWLHTFMLVIIIGTVHFLITLFVNEDSSNFILMLVMGIISMIFVALNLWLHGIVTLKNLQMMRG